MPLKLPSSIPLLPIYSVFRQCDVPGLCARPPPLSQTPLPTFPVTYRTILQRFTLTNRSYAGTVRSATSTFIHPPSPFVRNLPPQTPDSSHLPASYSPQVNVSSSSPCRRFCNISSVFPFDVGSQCFSGCPLLVPHRFSCCHHSPVCVNCYCARSSLFPPDALCFALPSGLSSFL